MVHGQADSGAAALFFAGPSPHFCSCERCMGKAGCNQRPFEKREQKNRAGGPSGRLEKYRAQAISSFSRINRPVPFASASGSFPGRPHPHRDFAGFCSGGSAGSLKSGGGPESILCRKGSDMAAVTITRSSSCLTFRLSKSCFTSASVP